MNFVHVEDAEDAADVLYRLLAERPHDAQISHVIMPTAAEHRTFIATHPYRAWFIMMVNDEAVGSIFLSTRNEIGVAVLRKYQRLGYASIAIHWIMRAYQPLPALPSQRSGKFVANVNPNNYASMKLFSELGFHHVQNTMRKD
jgi:RimJ/RimL family protein N-acetyltransferase